MGLCRFAFFSSSPLLYLCSPSSPSFLGPRAVSISFPNYPNPSVKFSPLPLLPRTHLVTTKTNILCAASASSSLSLSSMETPPQGYRRNVGICLVNNSKKVIYISLYSLCSTLRRCICMPVYFFEVNGYSFFFLGA